MRLQSFQEAVGRSGEVRDLALVDPDRLEKVYDVFVFLLFLFSGMGSREGILLGQCTLARE